jgi:transposase
MTHCILTGADVHDASMLLKMGLDANVPRQRSFSNDPAGRQAMIGHLKKLAVEAGGAKILFAYEASGLGFGLYDELTDAGITCHVLAPTKLERSPKHRRNKTDERDAEHLLQVLRNHVLAGSKLPAVWIPDRQTRDDRELVRAQRDATEKLTAIKTQIRCLLKRNPVCKEADLGAGWSNGYRRWLWRLSKGEAAGLGSGAQIALGSLLRQMNAIEGEIGELDEEIAALSRSGRYAAAVREVKKLKGVGILTAMVFLTELGDLTRFSNRRKLAAFLGLVPCANESGECNDRKGHITRQGPGRVRSVLCQAVWSRIRNDPNAQAIYKTLVGRNPKHKKIAVVAIMRRLAILMWHAGMRAGPPGRHAHEASTANAA